MFDLAAARLVWILVKWPGIEQAEADKLAKPKTWEIECQVEIVPRDADPDVPRESRSLSLDEIFGSEAKGIPPLPTDVEKFKALVRDWRRVKIGGSSAPMTDGNIAAMLRVPMFPKGFEESYLAAWIGQPEEREKNSEGSPVDGRAEEAPAKDETPAK
jgi:hypothetical protein